MRDRPIGRFLFYPVDKRLRIKIPWYGDAQTAGQGKKSSLSIGGRPSSRWSTAPDAQGSTR